MGANPTSAHLVQFEGCGREMNECRGLASVSKDNGLLSTKDQASASAKQTVICAVCDAVLPIPPGEGVRVTFCSFPDEPELVVALLAGAFQQVRCDWCKNWTAYESTASCMMAGRGKIFNFVPERVARALPDLREQLMAGLEPIMSEMGVTFELLNFTDAEEFRSAVAAEIRYIASPSLSEFSMARFKGIDGLLSWIANEADNLDRQVFAAAWVLAMGAVPTKVIVGVKEGEAGESPKPRQNELLESLRQHLREMLAYRLLRLAEVLADQGQLANVESEVERVSHGVVIDEEMLRFLAGLAGNYEQAAGTSAVQKYANDAVLAAAALLGDEQNPRESDWAGWYVAAELAERDPTSGVRVDRSLLVPVDFARRTADRQLLFAAIVRQLREKQGAEGGLPPWSWLQAQASLAADLDIPEEWIAKAYHLDVAAMPDAAVGKLEHMALDAIGKHADSATLLVRIVLGSLFEGDLPRFAFLAEQVVARCCEIGKPVIALELACYVSSELNEHSLCHASLRFLRRARTAVDGVVNWAELAAGPQAAFLTEEGNCLRYLGHGAEALKIYEECRLLVGTDLSLPKVRVNERNRAIVLRELGRIGQSQSILRSLVPHVSGEEKANVLLSLALVNVRVDQLDLAESLISQALAIVGHIPVSARTRWRLLVSGAEMARRTGDPGMALDRATEALGLSAVGGPFGQAMSMAVAIRAARDMDLAPDQFDGLNEGTIEVLERTVAAIGGLGPSIDQNMTLRSSLADCYRAAGRREDAEDLLLTTANTAEFANLGEAWKLWAQLAEYAVFRGDGTAARERLERAYRLVVNNVSTLGSQADQYSMMLDKDPLHRSTARAFLDGYLTGEVDAAALWVAADLQNSLALGERMIRTAPARAALSSFDAPTVDAAAARQLLLHPVGVTNAAVLEFLQTDSDVHALLTIIISAGADTILLPVSYPVTGLTKLREELLYAIEQWNPASPGDPLAESTEWRQLGDELLSAVRAFLGDGVPLWIVPGSVLAGAPLHAAFAPAYPCSYVPSFAVARVLRGRRNSLHDDAATWRPSSCFDFAVWQHRERESAVAAFQQASKEFSAIARAQGCSLETALGTSATRTRLFGGLAGTQCVRLSCHGFADPASLRFQLLVSDGVQLPPSSPAALQGERGQRFLVGWDELTDLPSCAPVIFSSACGSGAAAGAPGGERVGLDRPLLAAGALAYIAPQWSVPIAVVQPLLNQVITAYLTNPNVTLAESLRQETASAIAVGVPAWIAHSLAIHGDWL